MAVNLYIETKNGVVLCVTTMLDGVSVILETRDEIVSKMIREGNPKILEALQEIELNKDEIMQVMMYLEYYNYEDDRYSDKKPAIEALENSISVLEMLIVSQYSPDHLIESATVELEETRAKLAEAKLKKHKPPKVSKPKNGKGFVYLISSETGKHKIGLSNLEGP